MEFVGAGAGLPDLFRASVRVPVPGPRWRQLQSTHPHSAYTRSRIQGGPLDRLPRRFLVVGAFARC
jgi:hypothetical protein